MKYLGLALFLCVTGLNFLTDVAQASEEDTFLGQIHSPAEQAMGQGRSAIWTMPLVATQYQPLQPTPAMQAALQAQSETRFLDALILLDEAAKGVQAKENTQPEMNLLRASFLLQGNQSQQAIDILAPLLANTQCAADAYALTAMAYLQQGKMQKALDAAQRAQDFGGGMLPKLALSYALQGVGRLAEAHEVVHGFNTRVPQTAITLAREAELALSLDQVQAAKKLAEQAHEADATHPYVTAVSGLAYLIDGHPQEAKSAFETALQRDPKDAKALFGLGLAEIKLGHFQAGQEKLQAADEADPGNALILTYLGRLQQNLGQTGAASESWRNAEQADPKDPTPWLYQAQAELQANRPLDARESLREAQARVGYRSVYRGDRLLKEDKQVLQANLAEVQRQLGLEGIAFHTLSDTVGEPNSTSLRNQADLLQGQRFAESARRSLLLQSLFNEKPGSLPSALDIYGDGAGQTGASVPQHGVVGELNAQQTSYNNYDALFGEQVKLAADATTASKNTNGGQIRAGVGSDTLGLSLSGLQFKTDGFGSYQNLDNTVVQGVVQWRPTQTTQAFMSYETTNSKHGEIYAPADPMGNGIYNQYEDISGVMHLGLRHSLDDNSELRGLFSHQQTGQIDNQQYMSDFLPPSNPNYTGPPNGYDRTLIQSSAANSGELQYQRSGAGYTTQWGVSAVRTLISQPIWYFPWTNVAQQIYVDWQQALNPYWQLETGLAWGKNDKIMTDILGNDKSTYVQRWLPKLGLVYTPDSTTHVRLAAWKGLDDAAVGNASLSPVHLAGFILSRPSDTYNLVRGVALGADKQLDAAWLLEGQAQRRWTENPFSTGFVQEYFSQHIDESRIALHWQPSVQSLNVTLAYDDECFQYDPTDIPPNSVQRQHLRSAQLGLKWFTSPQWTANLGWSYNLLNATQQSSDINLNPILFGVWQHFNQTDASVSWRFNRIGSLDAGVRNATNTVILYTETDPLMPLFSQGRLTYAKVKLSW